MKINYILIICISLLVLPSVSALNAQDYLPHKQRTNLELVVSSNNATSCNWTYIQYPDNSKVFTPYLEMTKSSIDFNYTIDANNFTQLGSTCMGITCTDGATFEPGSICREVTPSGYVGTIGFNFLILILSLGIMVLGFYLSDAPIVIIGSFGLYFLALYILFFGIAEIKDPVYTWGIGLLILSVAMYISTKSTYELIVD